MINVALPKGRLGEKVYAMFAEAGYECPALLEPSRKLIFENTEAVSQAVAALRSQGKSVSAQRAIPEKLRYATLCDLRKEGAK